jgi:hypothetical protein
MVASINPVLSKPRRNQTLRQRENLTDSPPMYGRKIAHLWAGSTFARVAHRAFPAATVFYVSAASGVPVRTVEKHLRSETTPSGDALLAYLNSPVLGPLLQREFIRHADSSAAIRKAPAARLAS